MYTATQKVSATLPICDHNTGMCLYHLGREVMPAHVSVSCCLAISSQSRVVPRVPPSVEKPAAMLLIPGRTVWCLIVASQVLVSKPEEFLLMALFSKFSTNFFMLAQIMSSQSPLIPKAHQGKFDMLPKSLPPGALIILKQLLSINSSYYTVLVKVRDCCKQLLSPLCCSAQNLRQLYLQPQWK